MTHHKETFANCVIEVKDGTHLSINGKVIDYEYDKESNKWSSRYLPYTQYDSILEMAQAIAQHTVEFSSIKD